MENNPIKKMNAYTSCFCSLIRKLKTFENLKLAQGSQRRKQRISNYILNFHM